MSVGSIGPAVLWDRLLDFYSPCVEQGKRYAGAAREKPPSLPC